VGNLYTLRIVSRTGLSNRLRLPLPERCLLYQALLWTAQQSPPIEDRLFLALPEPNDFAVGESHKRDLLLALMTGHIGAVGIFWGERGKPLSAIEDQSVKINPNCWDWDKVEWKDSTLRVVENRPAWGSFNLITVPVSTLMQIFPSPHEMAPIFPNQLEGKLQQTHSQIRKGRPMKYDWSAFYAEIIVRADLDGLPDTQAELERAMSEWCLDVWGESPGESTMRERLALVYTHKRKASK
jgi:hypothetical protein